MNAQLAVPLKYFDLLQPNIKNHWEALASLAPLPHPFPVATSMPKQVF